MKRAVAQRVGITAIGLIASAGFMGAGQALADTGDPTPDSEATTCSTLGWVGDSTSVNWFGGEGEEEGTAHVALEDESFAEKDGEEQGQGGEESGDTDTNADEEEGQEANTDSPPIAGIFQESAPSVKSIDAIYKVGRQVTGDDGGVGALERIEKENDPDCYVVALGSNDLGANDTAERVSAVRKAAGDKQVFWVTPVIDASAKDNGYDVTPEQAQEFTKAVTEAAEGDDKLTVVDMSEETQPDWFRDGVHYTEEADQARGKVIAEAIEEHNSEGSDESDDSSSGESEAEVEDSNDDGEDAAG